MASVRKRTWTSGGVEKFAWQVDYVDQADIRRARQFPTKREAEAFKAQSTYEIRQGTHTPISTSITVEEAVKLWLKRAETKGRERNTLRSYAGVTRAHVVPILGRFKLAQLTRPIVEQYVEDLVLAGC